MTSVLDFVYFFTAMSSPIIQRLPPSFPGRRYLVCQEVTETGGDEHRRPISSYDYGMHHNSSSDPLPHSAPSMHNLLGRVWNRASSAVDRPGSPNFNPSWQGRMSPDPREAIDHVWQRARHANDRPLDYPPPNFNRMGSPPNNYPPINNQDPSFNRMPPPPMDNNWNRPDFSRPPAMPRSGSGTSPPPPTLGSLLSQAYRSRIPPARLP